MKKNSLNLFYFLLIILSVTAYCDNGKSTDNFLLSGPGSRARGMGNAYIAAADDVSAIYWNPAGLSQMKYSEIIFTQNTGLANTKNYFIGFAAPLKNSKWTAGISLDYFDYGKVEHTLIDYNQIIRLGEKTAKSYYINAAAGAKLSKFVHIGAGLKFLKNDFISVKRSTVGLDAAVKLNYPHNFFSIAFGIYNIGPGIKYIAERVNLPQTLKIGAYYYGLNNFNISLDVQNVIGEDYVPFKLGFEYILFDLLALRAGIDISSDIGNNFSVGIGAFKTNWFGDMAYTPFGDLGNSFEFSVKHRFGTKPEIKPVKEKIEFAGEKINFNKKPVMIPSIRNDIEDEEEFFMLTPAAQYVKIKDYMNAARIFAFLFYNKPEVLLYEFGYAHCLAKSGYADAAKKMFDKIYLSRSFLSNEKIAVGVAKYYYFINEIDKSEFIIYNSLKKWPSSKLLKRCAEYINLK